MTPQQAAQQLAALGASYVSSKGNVEWWRLPSGEWVGKMVHANGTVELRRFASNSCGC